MMTPLDSRVLDANAEALGIDVETLMGNAGEELAHVISDAYPDGRILFVCGTGNNGGDGFAAACHLAERDVTVALLSPEERIHTDAARTWYSRMGSAAVRFSDCDLDDYQVVVDCALGTGSRGAPRGPCSNFIDSLSGCSAHVVSADIPSGFGSGHQVRPELTVAFHDVKTGMTPDTCGTIVVADIGIPEDASAFLGPGDMLRYPVPDSFSHKGDNGRAVVVGGGPYIGAPAMAAMAAMRVGADLVRIATPASSYDAIASMCPAFTMARLPGDVLCQSDTDSVLGTAAGDTLLIGPGLGTDPRTVEAVRTIASARASRIVVDADGLNALAGSKIRFSGDAVLTPHRREAERLLGRPLDEPAEDAAVLAGMFGAVVLLKGPVDVITDGTRTRYNGTGTPAMTCGGTGDVLAGTVAGLMSKGMTAFDAACLAAYICGKAGEKAFETRSYGLIATDVIDCIPTVLTEGLR